MNLRKTIKKVLKEQTNFSPQFKRRVMLFKEFIKHCTPMLYPCDYENFYHFMEGIYSEVEEYSSGIYDYDDDNPTPDWLTYEEGTEFIETYMLDDLKSHYDEVCQNQDLNESRTSWIYFFGDEKETIRYNKILNKHMSKYDWWKGIKVIGISYNRGTKQLTLNAKDLNVDEAWGEEQWKIYVNQTFPGNKEEVVLGEIVGGDLYFKLREDFSKTFEFAFGLPVNSFEMNDISLNFISSRKEEETEGVGGYAAPAFEMKPDHVHFKHLYNEQVESNDPDYSPKTLTTLRKMVAKMDLPSVRDVKVRWNERGGAYMIGLYYENNTDVKLIEKNENKVWSMIPFFGLPHYSVLPQSYYINPEED